jgi:glycosyltransferase involved in cell wall biosynthesis
MPIVINEKSFKIAQKLNNRTQLISAFIPPPSIEELPEQIQNAIHDLQINYDQIFCTNAYNVSYDKYNREIYQISDLVSLFSTYTKKALIVSDPSGAYFKLLEAKKTIIPANIYFITIPHDFNAIIKESACMIRFTSTDGDSLSVKEALIAGVPVIATNVVDRPSGVTLVENIIQDLDQKIVENNFKAPVNFSDNGFITLEYIYKTHLSN